MKRFLKSSLSLILAITIIFSSAYVGLCEVDFDGMFAVKANAATSGITGDCTWTLNGDVLTISGNGDMENYQAYPTLPWGESFTSVIIENGVTSIGDCAFFSCNNLTSITIPDSVTSIGFSSFIWCERLTSITIPDSITSIDDCAFYGCASLTAITIPDSVTSIGEDAFRQCTNLTSITIPDGVTSISDGTFSNCTRLKDVTILGSVTSIGEQAFSNTRITSITIPDSVTSIGYEAFYDCSRLEAVYVTDIAAWCGISFDDSKSNPLYYAENLYLNGELVTDLVVPDGVTSIGARAFSGGTSLTSITIPGSVTSIGEHAFMDCKSLETVHITDIAAWCGISFGDSSSNPLYWNDNLYLNGELVTNLIIPDGVTSIGDFAFFENRKLVSITIPDSVTSIGDAAFEQCTNLTSISIPDSVTSIGELAFFECFRLTSVTIGNGVTSIGDAAFGGCESLTSIIIPDNVTSIGDGAFDSCASLTSITIPDSVTSIGEYAFYYCPSLTSVTIGNGVTSIGDEVFSECTSLTSITIPDSVTSIGEEAFYRCTRLASIIIPDSVSSIGEDAFYKTSFYNNDSNWENGVLYIGNHLIGAKTSIKGAYIINNGTKTIADSAFYGCDDLTSITIPGSVTNIGAYAFYGCDDLTSITIPRSVTKISNFTFCGCTCLTSITIHDGVSSIGEYAFSNCPNLASITIPDSVTSIGDFAFNDCASLASVTIPGSVTSIGSSVFYCCSSLASVTISNGVTSIGEKVFYNCTSLISIKIPDSVTNIGAYAFCGCDDLTSITIPDSVTSIDSYTFDGCTSLISIKIPDSVTSIASYAFSNCRNLTSITIPDSVTNIGSYAFSYCTSLTSITIPDSVTSIGADAFYTCSSLNAVYITDIAKWCAIDFQVYPVSEASSNPLCYAGNLYLSGELVTDLVVPGGVTSIGDYAFCNFRSLTSITIPDSLTSIGDEAFYNCTSLKDVYYTGMEADWIAIFIGYNNEALTGATIHFHEHSYSSWIIDKAATASAPGSKHKECTECGEILETAVIPQLNPATPKVATTNEINGINITWNAVEGAVKYNVYRRQGGSSNWILIGNTTGTSLADTNVKNGIYYVYSVRAYNSAEEYSDFDTTKTVTIQPVTAPVAVTTNITNGVQVKWSSVTGATKYNVYRRVGGSSSWILVGETTGTSIIDNSTTNGKYYVYSIRVINSTGYSAFDTKKTDTIQPVTAPTAVATNLTTGVQVKWSASSGATKYNVYRRIAGSSSWVLVGTTTGTSLVDKGVTNGKYYVYSIRAINGTGYSAFDTKKTDTIQPITAPTAKVVKKSTGVQVSWNSVSGATKYNVYRRLGGTSTWVYVGQTTSTMLLDKGVVKGKSYAYSIRAINGTGYSAYNSSKCASIKYS